MGLNMEGLMVVDVAGRKKLINWTMDLRYRFVDRTQWEQSKELFFNTSRTQRINPITESVIGFIRWVL